MTQVTIKRYNWNKLLRITAKTILYIILFLLLILLLVQTPPVQNLLRKKVVSYLRTELNTKVEIGRIYIGYPRDVVLSDVYVEDQQKDTLLSGGSIKADIDLWDLAFNNEIKIQRIALENITAKIKRQLPDTAFNFQFIVDAFATTDTSATKNDSTSSITLRQLELDKVRLLYTDILSGNNVEAWIHHLDTRIDKFDPVNMHFDVPSTTIDGVTATINQVKPLASPEPEVKDKIEALEPVGVTLLFKEADLRNIDIVYSNNVSALYSSFKVPHLLVRTENIDLSNRVVALDDLVLSNSNTVIRLGRKEQAKVLEKEAEQEVESQAQAGWQIRVASLDITNNDFQFDNDNHPKQNRGMDYAHLKADSLTLKATDIVISLDSIAGIINTAHFNEQSGFMLDELRTRFLYSNQQSYLQDLYLKTPGTELKHHAAISYASIEALQNDIGNMQVDINLEESRLLVSDLLTFVPDLQRQPAFAYPGATWYINSRITGRLADLQIDELQLQGLNDTRIDIAGRIGGLPAMQNVHADLYIRNASSSKRDISLFIPSSRLPRNISLPERFNVNGHLQGHSGFISSDLRVNTSSGNASVKGTFNNFSNINQFGYDAVITTSSLRTAALFKNNSLPEVVSGNFVAKGKGLDPKTADLRFDGKLYSVLLNDYNYRNLAVSGTIQNQQAQFTSTIADPNIRFSLNGTANLSGRYPSVSVKGTIDSMKLQPLHFTKDMMIYRGNVQADFPVTNPDNLQGKLLLTQSLFVHNGERLSLDTVSLFAGKSDAGNYLQLNSDIMTAKLEGQYQLTQLGNIFQQAIQPYFAVQPTQTITSTPYDFTLNAYILDNPALKVFIPGLQRIDSVSLQSHFSSSNGWSAYLNAPVIDMGTNQLRNFRVQAGTGINAINLNASIEQLTSGKNLRLDNTTLVATLANNTIDFTLNSKDNQARDKYNIKGIFQQPRAGDYVFSIKPDSLLLNYDTWSVSSGNQITFTKQGINARNVVLSRAGQQLVVNSLSTSANAPMELNFSNFKLATVTGFIQTDSTFANGTMNGKITFTDLAKEPVFVGDLSINDFSFKGDTVGNIRALINNRVANTYATDITLSGRGNDLRITGNYYVRPVNSGFDFDLDIRALPLVTAQAFSNGMMRNSTGIAKGKFKVTGNFDQPVVRGNLDFDKAAFNFKMLNSYFSMDGESIRVDEQGLHFDEFIIEDSARNQLIIDGLAATNNFSNYRFDLDVTANNFKALNSTKRDNDIFYGQLYFDADLKVQGTESAPDIDGGLIINDKTSMTVVLPQREPGIVEREGIVEFVDKDAPYLDSLFMAAYDSLNMSDFKGMDIAVNVEIVKEAEFNLIIDEGNGDFLNVKGEALLSGGIDPSGKINLTGSYELEQGAYELTFNFLRRRFDIEKGSRIVWEGEPTSATVDVKAVYIANAAPLDLVKNQLADDVTAYERNTYLQKLPFDVHLQMEGQLLKPQISFDIILPEKSYVVSADIITNVRTRLEQLRQEPGEMNKQVFSLLLLNRFVTENPFSSSTGGPNVAVFLRQSVSKLLTEQLNRLAADLLAGVDINFDVLSSEDYTTGERRDRTDLNVSLSKRLLNDRLKVSIGSNFELEGPKTSNQQSNNIAGNIALDYRISRDNRYLLRAYRKNEYQGVIEGYVIETGVGFIITVDYNRFRQLFMSRQQRQLRRTERKQQREVTKQKLEAAAQQQADSLRTN